MKSTRNAGRLVNLLLMLLLIASPHQTAYGFSAQQPPVTSSSVSPTASSSSVEPSNKATQIMQGTGVPLVDMNRYNIYSPGESEESSTLDEIQQEWTANLKQKANEQAFRVELGVQSSDRLFADTVQVYFPQPRKPNAGLGIELVQIKGGASSSSASSPSDGLGITLVSGLVPGGAADGLDILPGDSITKITLIRKLRQETASGTTSGRVLQDQEQAIPVVTECLDYDSTVDAILSLPECNEEKYTEHYIVTLKRIRRKPKVTVKLQYPPDQNEEDATIELFAGENLRMGMLKRGVKLNDPLAKRFDTKNGGNCGAGGLCRTCAVSVLRGADMLNPQRLAEQQMLADSPRWRLACKAIVGYGMKEGEISIRVNPRQFL